MKSIKYLVVITEVILTLLGLVLLVAPLAWLPTVPDVRYTGIAILVSVVIIYFLPRLTRVPATAAGTKKKNQAADLLQFLFVFAVTSDVLGSVGLYQLYTTGFQYDKILHFLTPCLGVIIFYIFIRIRLGFRPTAALGFAVAGILFSMVAWELLEYASDRMFGTHLQGFFRSDILNDTKQDLGYGCLGVLLGSVAALKCGAIFLRHEALAATRTESK